MIHMTEQERMYGLEIVNELHKDFSFVGYRPTHSEIYRALHDLLDDGVLEQIKVKKEGMKHQEVAYYRFKGKEGKRKANLYKKQLKVELERNMNLLRKAYVDIFGDVKPQRKVANS